MKPFVVLGLGIVLFAAACAESTPAPAEKPVAAATDKAPGPSQLVLVDRSTDLPASVPQRASFSSDDAYVAAYLTWYDGPGMARLGPEALKGLEAFRPALAAKAAQGDLVARFAQTQIAPENPELDQDVRHDDNIIELEKLANAGYPPAIIKALLEKVSPQSPASDRAKAIALLLGYVDRYPIAHGPLFALEMPTTPEAAAKDPAAVLRAAGHMEQYVRKMGDVVTAQLAATMFLEGRVRGGPVIPGLQNDSIAREFCTALTNWRDVAAIRAAGWVGSGMTDAADKGYAVLYGRRCLAQLLTEGRGGPADRPRAIALYREILLLDPQDEDAKAKLARLDPEGSSSRN